MDVIIPIFPSNECKYRERNLEYVSSLYSSVVFGECNDSVWRKGLAVRDGLEKATSEYVLVSDSDIVIPGFSLPEEFDVVRLGKWVYRLTEEATIDFIQGRLTLEEVKSERRLLVEEPNLQVLGGGALPIKRKIGLEYPMDIRFYGWGKQDIAWGILLRNFFKVTRLELDMVHLWHPPQERVARYVGNEHNEKLVRRYFDAQRDREKFSEILKEIKSPLK